MKITEDFLNSLEYQWSADILMNNNQKVSIWWTAWPCHRGRGDVKRILSVSTDLPKVKIKPYL
jgi:hypothetical protein